MYVQISPKTLPGGHVEAGCRFWVFGLVPSLGKYPPSQIRFFFKLNETVDCGVDQKEAAGLMFFGLSPASHRKALPGGSQNAAPSHRIPCKFTYTWAPNHRIPCKFTYKSAPRGFQEAMWKQAVDFGFSAFSTASESTPPHKSDFSLKMNWNCWLWLQQTQIDTDRHKQTQTDTDR